MTMTPDPLAYITPHFQWGEMLHTDHREPSIVAAQTSPPDEIQANVVILCRTLLEPVRDLTGPLRVSSGYRCPELNAAVGGAKTSRHMAGLAADLIPTSCGLVDAYERIAGANPWALDQLIFEYARWVHCGMNYGGQPARHQFLMCFDAGIYLPWDPNDPRVKP